MKEVAKRLLTDATDENAVELVSYLLTAMQLGHLCIRIKPDVYPIIEGHEEVSFDEPINEDNFVFESGVFQLKRYRDLEIAFEEDLERLYHAKPSVKIDNDLARTKVFQAVDKGELLKEQAECLLNAFDFGLTVITGGPGTGKTYTAGKLLQILSENSRLRIALTAPTGKAARNLQQALGSQSVEVEALTLHKLLKVNPSKVKGLAIPLPYDVIIVDESSMIDVEMMTFLLRSIRSGTRVVFLGDENQLPPVEAGALFSNLISLWKQNGRSLCQLTRCLRAELKDIVDFAHAVNTGTEVEFSTNGAVQKLPWDLSSFSDVKKVCTFAADNYAYLASDDASLNDVKQFSILTPLRRGLFGASSLNQRIFDQLKARHGQNFAVPILVKSSSKDFGLFNGDVGLLKEGVIHFEGGVKVPPLLVDYEYAFALSVHKSQGSEYDHVFLILPEGSERFGREVLYTGVTRAKRQLTLCGSDEVYKQLLQKKEERFSLLSSRREHAPVKLI